MAAVMPNSAFIDGMRVKGGIGGRGRDGTEEAEAREEIPQEEEERESKGSDERWPNGEEEIKSFHGFVGIDDSIIWFCIG